MSPAPRMAMMSALTVFNPPPLCALCAAATATGGVATPIGVGTAAAAVTGDGLADELLTTTAGLTTTGLEAGLTAG